MQHWTRRQALGAGGIALLGSLAGCSSLLPDSSTPETPSYDQLDVTSVYVADGVDLSLPSDLSTVSQPYNAPLLILPDETDADAEQAVEWLADDRVLALVGDRSESTWLSWVRSDAFGDHYRNEGLSEAQPAPSLVVGTALDLYVTTYRYSWDGSPSTRAVLGALDESLVKIENETPSG